MPKTWHKKNIGNLPIILSKIKRENNKRFEAKAMKKELKSALAVIAITLSLTVSLTSFQRLEIGDFELHFFASDVFMQRSLNGTLEKKEGIRRSR